MNNGKASKQRKLNVGDFTFSIVTKEQSFTIDFIFEFLLNHPTHFSIFQKKLFETVDSVEEDFIDEAGISGVKNNIQLPPGTPFSALLPSMLPPDLQTEVFI